MASVGAIQRQMDGLCAFGVNVATRTLKATGRVIAQREACHHHKPWRKGDDAGDEEVLVRWEPVVDLPLAVTAQLKRLWPDEWMSRASVPGGAESTAIERELILPHRACALLLRIASENNSAKQRPG